MKYLSVAEARSLPGLRLVLSAHVPGPWGEAAKAVLAFRKVPYVPVAQAILEPNEDLRAWTGVRNAPVAVLDDEPPLASWLEILLLAERLGSGPSLLPADPLERALALGLSCEICGPEGFGWSRRLIMMGQSSAPPGADRHMEEIRRSYGARPDAVAQAPARVISILCALTTQLRRQQAIGSDYLVGKQVSACDLYWACFSQMVVPLAPDVCPMPDWMRANYANIPAEVAAAVDPILIRHRDLVFQRHIGLPLDF